MSAPFRHIFGLLAAILLLLPSATPRAETTEKLPLPALMVLNKVSPLLAGEAYDQAEETLLAFQGRSKTAFDAESPDPKGYYHPEIYFALGNCYLLQSRYDAAAEAYQRTLARDPDHSFAWLHLARVHYETNQYADAGRCFEQAYETDPEKKPEILYYSAAARTMAGRYEEAIGIFERLLARHSDAFLPEWREQLVHALLAADRPRDALPHIKALINVYTGEAKTRWQEILLYQYLQLEMITEALDMALDLTREAPEKAAWWKALVHIQLNAGQYEDALAAMIVYSYLSPLSMEEKTLLADLNLQLGIPVMAAPVYKNCLEEKPDTGMLKRLVISYRQLGDPEKGLDCIRDFCRDDPDAELMLLQGEILYALKRYEAAASVCRRAAKDDADASHAGRAWLMAGYAAWQSGDITAAREAFKHATDFKTVKKDAKSALTLLNRPTTVFIADADGKTEPRKQKTEKDLKQK